MNGPEIGTGLVPASWSSFVWDSMDDAPHHLLKAISTQLVRTEGADLT